MYLADLSKDEVTALFADWGEPKYRAAQAFEWLKKGARAEEMTNLPQALREKLAAIPYGGVTIEQKFLSQKDGTVKYLFRLEDENLVEGVLMRYHYGNTLCLSTQVGCNMGCKFCASTLEGCVRNLRVGELLGQIHAVERDEPTPEPGHRNVTNLVLMGSGEPLDNYENVVAFLKFVTAQDGLRISARNISVSTCGIVPKIDSFIDDAPHVTLSISLHAHDDEARSSLMPINRAYPISELLAASRRYAEKTGRRVVFEYALIDGGERFPIGCGRAGGQASRHALPCQPDSAQPRPRTRACGRQPGRRAEVLRPINRTQNFRNRTPGDGHRYRWRLRTAPQEDFA